MARTISVSDDVYERMKRMKNDRSFSDLIRSMMKSSDLSELEGTGFSGNWDKVRKEIDKASRKTFDSIEEKHS